MGSWDVGPRDNDTALDFEDELFSGKLLICECLEKGLASTDENEQRIAAHLVASLGYSDKIQLKHRKIAKKKMVELLDNDEWISCWTDRCKIRNAIRKQIKRLDTLS